MRHTLTCCSIFALLTVVAACGSDEAVLGTPPAAADVAVSVSTETVPVSDPPLSEPAPAVDDTTTLAAAPDTGGGSAIDPCELLSPAVAGEVLGMPVGEPITQQGEGNTTCAYRPADPTAQSLVSLTVYSVVGTEAVLQSAAAAAFPDAQAVEDVGDAALISVQGQAIGVLFGQTVFALGLFPQSSDGQLLPVSADDLVAAAHAVLDGR